MELAIIVVGIMLLSFMAYAHIRRKQIFLPENKIQIKEIRPQGIRQILCFVLIPLTLCAVAVMFHSFYGTGIIYTVKHVCIIGVLWPIAVCDYRELRIPNKLILYGLILRAIIIIWELISFGTEALLTLKNEGIAAVGAVILCLLCMVLSRGSLGMGDLKLMIVLAAFLGIAGFCYAMFVSVFFSFIVAVALLISRKKSRKDAIPFAPFILAGTFVSIILTGI